MFAATLTRGHDPCRPEAERLRRTIVGRLEQLLLFRSVSSFGRQHCWRFHRLSFHLLRRFTLCEPDLEAVLARFVGIPQACDACQGAHSTCAGRCASDHFHSAVNRIAALRSDSQGCLPDRTAAFHSLLRSKSHHRSFHSNFLPKVRLRLAIAHTANEAATRYTSKTPPSDQQRQLRRHASVVHICRHRHSWGMTPRRDWGAYACDPCFTSKVFREADFVSRINGAFILIS